MTGKKFVLNADDLGLSKNIDRGVIDGYNSGVLKSASLCANGETFEAENRSAGLPSAEYRYTRFSPL